MLGSLATTASLCVILLANYAMGDVYELGSHVKVIVDETNAVQTPMLSIQAVVDGKVTDLLSSYPAKDDAFADKMMSSLRRASAAGMAKSHRGLPLFSVGHKEVKQGKFLPPLQEA